MAKTYGDGVTCFCKPAAEGMLPKHMRTHYKYTKCKFLPKTDAQQAISRKNKENCCCFLTGSLKHETGMLSFDLACTQTQHSATYTTKDLEKVPKTTLRKLVTHLVSEQDDQSHSQKIKFL